MSRKPIIAGNWKMHNNNAQSIELTEGLKAELKEIDKNLLPEVVIAPVFTSLYVVNEELNKCGCGKIKMASQNCYYEPKGAFTGEVSIDMLKDFGFEVDFSTRKIDIYNPKKGTKAEKYIDEIIEEQYENLVLEIKKEMF